MAHDVDFLLGEEGIKCCFWRIGISRCVCRWISIESKEEGDGKWERECRCNLKKLWIWLLVWRVATSMCGKEKDDAQIE